ncbi:hypothetical protein [Pseudonocardia adelaidensis]|uniref:Uncharacterized protein n=1 Tax=Pseudonocardia adelaidensis TaxID=648754 RepID=A0ABP9NEH0_9PSEU
MTTVYDRIGCGYRNTRRPDPRIAAQVTSALSGMTSVVSVCAGAWHGRHAELSTLDRLDAGYRLIVSG